MASLTNTAQPWTWQRLVRRVRVPLGFVVAAIFLVFARPTRSSLLLGLLPVLLGLWIRGYAAGYVKKNAELTVTGPYAYTRNPLYLGSALIAGGVAVAAGRWWLVVLLVSLFALIYIPTILNEERYLRGAFPEFEQYARRVPRLLPRLTPARLSTSAGRFAPSRYRHHREYNALVGSAAIYAVLVARLLLRHGS